MVDQTTAPRILIVNPFGIGDVLFTTPVLASIRHAYPKARIVYICNQRTQDIVLANPHINQVMVYDRDQYITLYKRSLFVFMAKWKNFRDQIKRERFDIMLDFSLNRQFAAIGRFAGIKKRIGFNYKGRGHFLTHQIPLEGFTTKHMVQYYLDLLPFMGISPAQQNMELYLKPADQEWAMQWINRSGIPSQGGVIGLVPGGGASWGAESVFKRLPVAKYADLLDKIVAQTGAAVILFGDEKEQDLYQQIARLTKSKTYSAIGTTSITQMAALMQRCKLVVVNDGGPLHVAVAAGVKTVSIFGPVNPVVYGPYPSQGHEVVTAHLPCQPCYRNFRVARCSHLSCLQQVSVEDIFRKVVQQL